MKLLFRCALRLKDLLRSLVMLGFHLMPLGNSVVFSSFSGKAYSDNPRAISEALHVISPETEIIWLFQSPSTKRNIAPDYIKCLKIHSFQALRALATARVWVDNMPKPLYTKKRRGQFYVQTWHGDRGFKKMLYDAHDHPKGKPILEEQIADLLVSGSVFCEGTYHTGFHYFGEIAKFGSPRNDILLNPSAYKILQLKASLGLHPEDKLLLYAPTMRNASRRQGVKQQIQPIDLLATLDALENRFGGSYKCLVRCHATQLGLTGFPDSDRIIDLSTYEDMADLLLISDVLITDYSSSASDFALTGRPVILFQDDREGFAKSERTFYFDIEKSPYFVVTGQAELETLIAKLTEENAQKNDKDILGFYHAYETGYASEKLAEILQKHLY